MWHGIAPPELLPTHVDANAMPTPWLSWEEDGEPDAGRLGMMAAGIRYKAGGRTRFLCRLKRHTWGGMRAVFYERMPMGGGEMSGGPWCSRCGQLVRG